MSSPKMPDYTTEEKVRAFDSLWEGCGAGKARLDRWQPVRLAPRSPSEMTGEEKVERVPIYQFMIMFTGHVDNFADVLHALTKEKAPDQ